MKFSFRTFLTCLLVSSGIVMMQGIPFAYAVSNGQNAIDAVGQFDDTVAGFSPVFTKGSVNNTPNILGLNNPMFGLVIDGTNHRLFLSDTTNNRVLVYNLNSSNVPLDRLPDYVIGQPDFHTNTAATTQAGLNVPVGLAYDTNHNRLFVAQETGNRVTIYDLSSGITNGQNAAYLVGQTSFTVATAGTTLSGLKGPESVYYDNATNRLFVAQSTGNRVTVYDFSTGISDGQYAYDALGQYDDSLPTPGPLFTTGTAQNAPNHLGISGPLNGIAMDKVQHRLFLSDSTNNRVLVYNLDSSNFPINRIPDYVLGQVDFQSNVAATTQAGLKSPEGLTFDPVNNLLFVADTTDNRIEVFDVTSITNGESAVHVIGQSLFTTATAATSQTGLNVPVGIYYDTGSTILFVAQNTGNRVTTFDLSAGITDGQAANHVLGQSLFTTATAATTQAGMNVPYDVTYDRANKILFVSQGTGNRVTTYDISSGITDGQSANHVLGQSNFTNTALGNTQTGMNAPRGITYDNAHKLLYVSQTTGNRVTIYDLSSGISDNANAAYVIGQSLFTVITAGITQTGLSGPNGVLYDDTSKRLYVVQATANRVTAYDFTSGPSTNQNAVSVLGQFDDSLTAPGPIFTTGAANNAPNILGLSAPLNGILLDRYNHRLFLSDSSNNRVLEYDLDSSNTLIDRVPDHVLGQPDFHSNAATITQTTLRSPEGLAYDNINNRLFVSDTTNNRVVTYDVSSITNGEAASNVIGQTLFTTATAATSQAGLNVPVGIYYDTGSSLLFVAQNTANRVTTYDLSGGISDGQAANHVLGQSLFTTATAATTQAGMNVPFDVTYDRANKILFVSQGTGHRVTTYDISGGISDGQNANHVLGQADYTSTALGNTQVGMNAPRGITYDNTNKRLFVSQTTGDRVTVYDLSAGISNGQAASNVIGQSLFTVITAAITQTGLSGPNGVAYDSGNNRLYVLQATANRVTIYDLTVGISNGKSATAVLGQSLFTTATAATTQAGMNVPYGVTYDSTNQWLFVSQGTGNRVTTYDISGGITNGQNARNVLGQADFTSTAAGSTQTGMNAPRGITYDNTNKRLFVTQTTGNRVAVYDLSSGISNGQNAVNVLGQPDFTTITAGTTQTGLSGPSGVLYDNTSKALYVSDSSNARVLQYDLTSGVATTQNAADVLGQYDQSISAPGPIFTKGSINNTPNATGFSAPQGVTVDATNHRLFVADTGNNRVLVYSLDSTDVLSDYVPDYVLGQANVYANTAATTQTGLSAPTGLSYDPGGNRLFVADGTNNRILIYDLSGIATGMNAAYVLGQSTFTVATAGTTQTGLSAPKQITFDGSAGKLFVADGTNNRIVIYDVGTSGNGGGGSNSSLHNMFYFYGY